MAFPEKVIKFILAGGQQACAGMGFPRNFEPGDRDMASEKDVQVQPPDEYNRSLVSNVHPPGWENPEPSGRYNMVVVGAGTAGLVTAAGAAWLGARVALVEKHLLGGDCLNTGCVPSKAIIRSSRAVRDALLAPGFGVPVPQGIEADFPAVMERMRKLRSQISAHDSAKRFRDLGVDLFLGEARFQGEDSVLAGGKTLRFHRAVIATGARPAEPAVEGLAAAGYLTNETVFSITALPRRLAVIGGGPLGCELAQAFRRLGSEVTIFQGPDHLLGREDADAAKILQERLIEEGIRILLHTRPVKVSVCGATKLIDYERGGAKGTVEADEILAGAGRVPNVEGLGLDAAGVEYDTRGGVHVDDFLRTANPRIYAAGDVCLPYKFTHTADATARLAIRNALFPGRARLRVSTIPWVTYTDPEIAHVGMYEREAQKAGIKVDTFFVPLGEVDRAVLDGETEGFVKIHVKRGSDRIAGATIVARHAGEMISEITLAMASGIGLGALANVIHPYPTQAEAIKRAADLYLQGRLTPLVKRILSLWMRISRRE